MIGPEQDSGSNGSSLTDAGAAGARLATVTRIHAHTCEALPDGGEEVLSCVLSGKLYEDLARETKPVAVGDRVELASDGKNWSVAAVLPRRNCLRRPAIARSRSEQIIAANVDLMLVVAAFKRPDLKPGLIDRFLVAAGVDNMDAVICINKIDLVRTADEEELLESYCSIYAAAGYRVVKTSASEGRGVAELRESVAGGINLIVGHSGVGKSTLLNAMDPSLRLATTDISRKSQAGRHTTSAVSLLRISGGGFFIDTPGIREFGISSIEPHQLGLYFPEIAAAMKGCRYPSCTHDHEPDCAVRVKVDTGEISSTRYESYLRLLASL